MNISDLLRHLETLRCYESQSSANLQSRHTCFTKLTKKHKNKMDMDISDAGTFTENIW